MSEKLIGWKSEDTGPLKVQLAGITYPASSYRIERCNSNCSVLELIISGSGFLEIGEKRYKPKAGDVYIVPYGSNHKYYSSSKTPWKKMWFNMYGPLFPALLDSYELSGIHLIRDANLHDLFQEGLDICEDSPSDAEEALTLVIHTICMELAKCIRQQKPELKKVSLPLKNYLDSNVDKSPTLHEMSSIIHRSESQTIRIFKKEWGTTPHQYMLNKKISIACTMLTNSSKSIKDIASELDFDDEYYFSSIFKKKTGLAPKFYRNSHVG